MKILFVGRSCHIGGVPNVRLRAAHGLIPKGHEIHLLAQGGPMASEFKKAGVHLHLTGPTPLNRLHLALLLKRERFDLVHADNAAAGDDVLAAFKWAGLRGEKRPAFVVAIHGLMSPKVKEVPCLPKSDCAIVFDTSTTQRLRTLKDMADHPIRLVRRPVEAYSIPTQTSEAPHFVFVSRLSKSKSVGARAAMEAIEDLTEQWPEIRLTIVGDGSQRKELQQLGDEINTRHNREIVLLTGALKDPFPLMAKATGVIGTAMVAMEALFHGIPVVAAGYQGYGIITENNIGSAVECNFGDAVLEPCPITKALILEGMTHILTHRNTPQENGSRRCIAGVIRREHGIEAVSSNLERIYSEAIWMRQAGRVISRSEELEIDLELKPEINSLVS